MQRLTFVIDSNSNSTPLVPHIQHKDDKNSMKSTRTRPWQGTVLVALMDLTGFCHRLTQGEPNNRECSKLYRLPVHPHAPKWTAFGPIYGTVKDLHFRPMDSKIHMANFAPFPFDEHARKAIVMICVI